VTVEIATLQPSEVEQLCALARTIWREHYPPIIGEAQTDYMLEQRYTAQIVGRELESDAIWWDVLKVDREPIAFASSLRLDPSNELKLDKLYVRPDRQRHGYGGLLIGHTCARARELGCDTVVLAVNKRNSKAIAAYRKHGFAVREAVVKEIGSGFVMDDYIMVRRVRTGA
jgi:GNAT superfamily N-acetyltransferase